MKPTILRDTATTPDGTPLTLHERDGMFTIRVGPVELMSNRQHHSEERLAELACEGLRERPRGRVLIGGLGMGFTLRAALGRLGADAEVVVAELIPAVIRWNQNPAYGLGADALADPPVPARWTLLDGLVRHTFTHFHLELSVARATATTDRLARLLPGSAWCTLDLLDDRALPTVMRKVIEKASLA